MVSVLRGATRVNVRHTRFPRPRDVGNRIKAVLKKWVALERKPVIQNPFQDTISKLYVLQNYKTKTVSARGERKGATNAHLRNSSSRFI